MSGAAALGAAAAGAASVVLLLAPTTPGDRLRRAGLPGRRDAAAPAPSTRDGWGLRLVIVAALTGAAVSVVVGGWLGPPLGAATAFGLWHWLRSLETRAGRARRLRLSSDLPAAADLLAACLVAGSTVEDAVEAVADAVGGPLAERLRHTLAVLRLGGDPAQTWTELAAAEPELAPLGRAFARAATSGAAVSDVINALAEEQRRRRRWAAEAAARRVGVSTVAPLGACFLPAFLLLGVVPLVAGLAGLVSPGLQ